MRIKLLNYQFYSISYFCILFFCLQFDLLASDVSSFSDLKIDDKVMVIDKNQPYDLRVYIFTDLSSCANCDDNIKNIHSQLKEKNCEFVVFFTKANQNDVNEIRQQYGWRFKVIPDEFGIYKTYYKVRLQPLMYILDNNGKVLAWDKVGGFNIRPDSIVKLLEIENHKNIKTENDKKYLEEIGRIQVVDSGRKLFSGLFRNMLFNSTRNQFILNNNRKSELILFDSTGSVIKKINNKTNPEFNFYIVSCISWAYIDSVIYIYGFNDTTAIFQYYDIIRNKFSDQYLPGYNSSKKSNRDGFESLFITNKNVLLKNIMFYNNNHVLQFGDTIAKICDVKGNLMKIIDTPDETFIKFKKSSYFAVKLGFEENYFFTIQNLSNVLKKWDYKFNLLATFELDMGSKYRTSNFDLDNFNDFNDIGVVSSKISNTQLLLVDTVLKRILIYFQNETYPKGVKDFTSDEVIIENVLNFYNYQGEKINSKEILLPKRCIPFNYCNSVLYTTDLNGSRLEIVIYKLNF